jgi:hypothetical protein
VTAPKERPWWNPSRAEQEANRPGPFSPGREGWLQKRRQRVVDEIERNRRGEYAVPTWVLAAALVAIIVALVLLFSYF